ncbi:MAG: Ig-like domain-containing protein [bacterium]
MRTSPALIATLLGCAALAGCKDGTGPTTGAARVAVTTAGLDLDPDGYLVTVDGELRGPVGPVDAVTIPDLATGAHTVALGGVAVNCTVNGDAAPAVMVTAGDTVQVAFEVGCAPMSGSVHVTVATSGLDLDPDGFAVALDGGAEQPVAVNSAVQISPVVAGEHMVELRGVAQNCTVGGALTRNVTLAAGAPGDTIRPTAEVAFAVTCNALTGDLRVTVATTGVDVDPDGYLVSGDGGPEQAVAINGALTISGLPTGDHRVRLSGVAGNCAADGDNPRIVSVLAGATVGVTFALTCSALTGSLRVTISTTGADLPDGYTVMVDGGPEEGVPWVPANSAITFSGLAVGEHAVTLHPVPANCAVSGVIPRQVRVIAGDTVEVTVAVTCAVRTGSVRVTTATTGADLDPDGYSVGVDQPIGINDSLTITGLSVGQRLVELGDVAPNCAVSGVNPQTVTVVSDDTAEVAFAVTCVGRSGSVRVTVATTGADLDPNGYLLEVAGNGQQLSANGSFTYPNAPTGDYPLELRDVASNCAVSGPNPQTVTVHSLDTAEVVFTVTCTGGLPSLRVTIATTGADFDFNGYTVRIAGWGFQQAVPVNGSVAYTGLTPGEYSVELSDVAPNCTVSGPNPQPVTIVRGATAEVAFAVACNARPPGTLQVTVQTTGESVDPDGYTVSLDGGPPQPIAVNGAVTFTNVPVGGHAVELGDVAGNCFDINGPDPQTVTIGQDNSAAVAFGVDCVPHAGSLRVTTVTTGYDLDPNGYLVEVLGNGRSVPSNGSYLYLAVQAGERSVELRDVASNCAVSGANPRTVTVTAGATAEVAFVVTCIAVTGSIRVTTATTGADLDSDGYTVNVDEGAGQPLPAPVNGSFTYPGVPPGEHPIELYDIASNCAVSGANPQTVTVTAGATAEVAFAIACTALIGAGSLRVTTATAGTDLDPDGYSVSVDGGVGQAVPVNGAIDISGLPAGDHTVALGGVAANCVVDGANPRTVSVAGGATAEVGFAVGCSATPTTGWLRVTTATTGDALDPDGYTVAVEGLCERDGYFSYCDYERRESLEVNGAVTIPDVPPGDHWLRLENVARNCKVLGDGARTTTVAPGDTAVVAFAVTCESPGAVQVTVASSGEYLDTDGYAVRLDGGPGQAAAINGAITIPDVLAGQHAVALDSVALNCAVDGTNPRSVSVPAGDTAVVSFTVTCTTAPGYLSVKWTTTGVDLDPDGYTLLWDGVSIGTAGLNGQQGGSGVPAGDHTIGLGDVASNCTVDGANPRTVSIAPYTGTAVAFSVTCTALPEGVVASVTVVPESVLVVVGNYTQVWAQVRDAAGTLLGKAVTWTTSNPAVATILPTSSATAQVSGVARGRSTITATSDGRSGAALVTVVEPARLTMTIATAGVDLDPSGYRVSLDGSDRREVGGNATITIDLGEGGEHTVGLSDVASNCTVGGENPRRVFAAPEEEIRVTFEVTCVAVGKIALVSLYQDCYVCDEASPWTSSIEVIHEDGSNAVVVANAGAASPAWSPDGARIAFERGDIWVVDAAGGNPTDLTNDPAWDGWPAWSPDGSRIAFASNRDGRVELYLMNIDGTGVVRLTNDVGFAGRPAWSPDGATIVFNCVVEAGNPDICAVSADGTGFARLTSEPGWDHSPAWSPDGSSIAFATARYGGAVELALMNPDGSGVRRVGAAGDEPAWSPDGTRLAFSWATPPEPCYSYAGCREYWVAVVNADGSGLMPMLASGYSPAWRPRVP